MGVNTIIAIVIGIILLILLIIYAYWRIKENGLNKFIIEMITKAEEEFNEGENEEKINFVIDKVIMILPRPIQLIVTREMIKKLVQDIFDKIKIALDYNSVGK